MAYVLRENPFVTLAVALRDTRETILDKERQQGLAGDAEKARNARQALTTPRLRLAAEIGFLPGVAPTKANALITAALKGHPSVLTGVEGIPHLAACNVLAGLLDAIPKVPGTATTPTVKSAIAQLVQRFQQIQVLELWHSINEDRQVAGLPLLSDAEAAEGELKQLQAALASCMLRALKKLSEPHTMLTSLVSELTRSGEGLPILATTLVSQYQLDAQGSLDELEQQIRTLIQETLKRLEETKGKLKDIGKRIQQLETLTRQWDGLAQPIQLAANADGSEDQRSSNLANDLREMSLVLWNKYAEEGLANRLNILLGELFAELPQTAAQLAEDRASIERVFKAQDERLKQQEAERAAWEKEISLRLQIGSDPLSISPAGIQYRGAQLKLEEIDRLRWWIYKHYVNGIRVSREFVVTVGNPQTTLKIDCVRMFEGETVVLERWNAVVNKTWRAVGVRLLTASLGRLSRGEELLLGGVTLNRKGAYLDKRKFFKSERIHFPWTELSIGNGAGSFFIQAAKVSGTTTTLSYRDVDNVHVLEALIRFLWKDGNFEKLERGEFS